MRGALLFVLLLAAAAQGAVLAPTLTSGEEQFSGREVVRPTLIHNREKRHLDTTRDEGGSHVHDLGLSVPISGQLAHLDLRLNRELLAKEYFVRHQGAEKIRKPSPEEVDLCEYNGFIRGKPDSWVALSTCKGVSGVIFDGVETYYIEPKSKNNSSATDEHFLFRHSNLQTNHTCGFPDTPHHLHDEPAAFSRFKRSVGEGTSGVIRAPFNSNKQSRYVELVFVVDNREFKELGTLEAVHSHCKSIANIINSLYSPLNIFIALVGVVVWSEHDEIVITANGDTTLSNFLHYRRSNLAKSHPNDNAQLLTRMQFDGGVVGKALKGPICTYEFSGGISVDHSSAVGLVATTVAHEMGHNFGMEHDNSDCLCPTDRCIMAPSSNSRLFTHWSDCSLEYLAHAFEHGMDYCLRNKPEKLFESPVCGNDFVEPGEQCDCGLVGQCNNPCCNPATCMLHQNATCATGKCCDLETCRPRRAGTECRTADHECDLPEFCTGESEFCPDNVYKMDGEMCNKAKAYCYKGTCRTHSDQCKLLWGPSGVNSENKCYQDMNIKGTQHGNCGYNRLDHSYIKCDKGDVMCGMLHCKHLNERLEFGMESVATLSQTFLNTGGDIIACRNAIVDLGLNEVDPGLAPDGSKCGEGKMCVNQKCMAVESLKMSSCDNNCNGHGICNSMGQCHCEVGYAPPDCLSAGFGGSLQSGPASDPNGTSGLQKVIIFLMAVCLMALVLFLAAYMAHRWRSKRPPVADSNAHSKPAASDLSRLSISRPLPPGVTDGAQASLLTATEQLNSLIAQHKALSPPPPAAAGPPVLVPIRPAPPKPTTAPENAEVPRGYQAVAVDSPTHTLEPPPVRVVREGGSTLSRIASILKPVPHGPPPAPGPTHTKPSKAKINRDNLRSLHISEPIPLQNIEVPGGAAIGVAEAPRPVVMRAQSMRDAPGAPPKAPFVSFGSMRAKRPTSIGGVRPSAPPPPRPPSLKEPLQYDDCGPPAPPPPGAAPLAHIDEETTPTSADNIYAVIEECAPTPKAVPKLPREYTSPTGEYKSPKPVDNAVSAGSVESVGLLSEIVNEMQARNIESIYTTTSLKDEEKGRCPSSLSGSQSSGTYVNALYTNVAPGGSPTPSHASSNQYLRPSAVMPPPPLPAAPPAAPFSTFQPAPAGPKKPLISAPMLISSSLGPTSPEDRKPKKQSSSLFGRKEPQESNPKSPEDKKNQNGPKKPQISGPVVGISGLNGPKSPEDKTEAQKQRLKSPENQNGPKRPQIITSPFGRKEAQKANLRSPEEQKKAEPVGLKDPPKLEKDTFMAGPKVADKPRPLISNPTLISSSAGSKGPSPALFKSVLAAHEGAKMAQRPLPEKPTITGVKVPPPPAARKTVGPGGPRPRLTGGPDLLAACERPTANREPDVLDKPKQPPPPPSRTSTVAALQHKFETRAAK